VEVRTARSGASIRRRTIKGRFRCWHEPDQLGGLARSGNKEDRKLLAEGQADAIDPKRAFDSVRFQQHATDKPMTSAHWSKADTLVAFVGRLMGNNAYWRPFGFFMEPN